MQLCCGKGVLIKLKEKTYFAQYKGFAYFFYVFLFCFFNSSKKNKNKMYMKSVYP